MNKKILNIWDPVKSYEDDKKIFTEVWGRKYTAGNSSFIESIVSQKINILSEPVRLTGIENGLNIQWGKTENFLMNDNSDEESTVCSCCESRAFVVNTTVKTEFDGCMNVGLSVMPRGRSVKQCFGLEEDSLNSRTLEKLYLEIPINKNVAKFYHFFPNSAFVLNNKTVESNSFTQADCIEGHMQMPFKEQVLISNDDVGIGVFFESDKGFQNEKEKCVEIFETEKSVVLRYRLFDSEPYAWRDKGDENGIDLYPIMFNFGIQVTPVKPFPDNQYEEHAIHIDCFVKISENYEGFLLNKYDSNETMLDRYKRLGVNTLYIHEKWNDIQNSPFLTEKTAKRLKIIVSEAHKRNIKVIPYFGYEISTLSPYFSKLGGKVMRVGENPNYEWHWYRYPYQRDPMVCYNSNWQDIFADGIENLIDEFNFDGIYLDGTIRPMGCSNEKHGCGYRDAEDKLHMTYPIWSVRKMMKRLYKIIDGRGGIINCHGSAAFNVSVLSFCHSIWEGEMIQSKLMNGSIDVIPDGHCRSVFTGRKFGVVTYMLCYSNPPVWNFESAIAQSIAYGIYPKPNDSGKPLELMSDLWNITDKFNFKGAVWHPYYSKDNIADVSDGSVTVSYYENKNSGVTERLVFVTNLSNSFKENITINFNGEKYDITHSIKKQIDNRFDLDAMSYNVFIEKTGR